MAGKRTLILILLLFLTATGCRLAESQPTHAPQYTAAPSSTPTETAASATTSIPTVAQTATETPVAFEVGEELTIDYLRNLEITGSEITFERTLNDGINYHTYLASYISEGSKIYGVLTIPFGDPPEGGFKAIVFNHGFIPPDIYETTERYVAYVDYLARSGFVVFKIDYRGHANSEGEADGSYYSPGYTIDAISAFKSLQMLDGVDPDGIGMWGHSMGGNVLVRAMLVEPEIKAGVIWAGAVYSYADFVTYGIENRTIQPRQLGGDGDPPKRSQVIFETHGPPDLTQPYWQAVSLTENIDYLEGPLQIHHAEDDTVVNIGYSYDLAAVLQEQGKYYEFYTYQGGGHNIVSPYFDTAMARTVAFFNENL